MKINKNYQSSSEEETKKIAKDFAKLLKSGDVVALFGDLGSGKTVFVKGLARSLGIKTTITSPTFVLIKSYPIYRAQKSLSFYHLDLYRVSGTKDIKSLGLKELFSKDSIVPFMVTVAPGRMPAIEETNEKSSYRNGTW